MSGNQDTGSAADPQICEFERVTSMLWLSISFLFRKGVPVHKAFGTMQGTKEVLSKHFGSKNLLKGNCCPTFKAQSTTQARARAVDPVGKGPTPWWAVVPGRRTG